MLTNVNHSKTDLTESLLEHFVPLSFPKSSTSPSSPSTNSPTTDAILNKIRSRKSFLQSNNKSNNSNSSGASNRRSGSRTNNNINSTSSHVSIGGGNGSVNNTSRSSQPVFSNKLAEYMTCVICFQLVTNNRECSNCHCVCCASCLNQFHAKKDKSIRRPCPTCNLPTTTGNEDEDELDLITSLSSSSLAQQSNHAPDTLSNKLKNLTRNNTTKDNSDPEDDNDQEKDLIDSFLGNVSGNAIQTTKLTHNQLIQKMVDGMPSRCPYCQTACQHGKLVDHYPNCTAHVTYGDYYKLGKSFDVQHGELLEMEREIRKLRRLCQTQKLTIEELEQESKELTEYLQEKTTQLQATNITIRQLDHENLQFKETIERLSRHYNISQNNTTMTSTQKSIAHELQDIDGLLHELHELVEVESKPTKEDRIQMMVDCLNMARNLQHSITEMKLVIRERLIHENDANVRREILNFQDKYDLYVKRAYRDILDQYDSLQKLKRVEFENLLLGIHTTQYNEQISGRIVEKIKEKVRLLENKIQTPRTSVRFSEVTSRDMSHSTASSTSLEDSFFWGHPLIPCIT